MSIEEGNKLINDLMSSGIDPIPDGIGIKEGIISGDYHRDLAILSLVANKIKKFSLPRVRPKQIYTGHCELRIQLEFDGPYHECKSSIYGRLYLEDGSGDGLKVYIDNKDKNPCMALWLSIVEFIQWYNSNTQTTDNGK